MSERTIDFHPDLLADARQRIRALLGGLTEEGAPPAEVAAAFKRLEVPMDELLLCAAYDPGDRVRCEIARCDAWVLLALFWDRAETCIHDHDDSDCGFRLLAGELEETRFKHVSGEKVRPVAKRRLEIGPVNKSSKGAIHRLGVPADAEPRAVSLHAYSPVLECEKMGVYQEVSSEASV